MTRTLPIVAVIVLAASVATFFLQQRGTSVSKPVPILTVAPRQGVSIPIPHQGSFGYGLPVVMNRSDRTAVLDSVSLVRPSPGLQTVHVYVGRQIRAEAWATWPPPANVLRQLHEVKGFQVPAHASWQPNFVFHLRLAHKGIVRSPGVLIRYHSGTDRFTLIEPLRLAVCSYSPCYAASVTG